MVKITVAGDLLSSQRMNDLAAGDYHCCFEKTTKLAQCDYLIGNLETTVAGEELEYTNERYCFNTPEGILAAIKDCGFQLLTLANNHIMDRGEQGIHNTIKHCRQYGFDLVGVQEKPEDSRVLVKDFGELRVAFVNYTYGTNAFYHKRFLEHPYMVNLLQPEETKPGSIHLLNDYGKIAEDVQRIYIQKGEEYAIVAPYLNQLEQDIRYAKENADYVIMLLHCGGQYVQPVDPYTSYIAEKIKEFGADIIIGNHQHIVQSCKTQADFLKVFCLGNMLYDSRLQCDGCYYDEPSYNAVLHLELSKDAAGKVNAQKSFSIYTTMYDDGGMPVVIDSFDAFQMTWAAAVRYGAIRHANLFVGEEKYQNIQERYELLW